MNEAWLLGILSREPASCIYSIPWNSFEDFRNRVPVDEPAVGQFGMGCSDLTSWYDDNGRYFNKKNRCRPTSAGNPSVEIRLYYDRLTSTRGFPIPLRRYLYIDTFFRRIYMHFATKIDCKLVPTLLVLYWFELCVVYLMCYYTSLLGVN